MSMLRYFAILLGFLVGCSSPTSDSSPTGALKLFLTAMERASYDPRALKEAYELLAPSAQYRLRKRAELSSALARREFLAWDMLPAGRFRLRFNPRRRGGYKEHIDGNRAVVVVTGERPNARAEVPMVNIQGKWRVALEIPVPPKGPQASAHSDAPSLPTGY